jgi:hypothetical protein
MKVSINKKYTSGGRPIRILCTDREATDYPVVGIFENNDVLFFKENGENIDEDTWDLIEVWEPKLGEWCWFWNNNTETDDTSENIRAHGSIYSGMNDTHFKSIDDCIWDNCVKYASMLPEHLKKD